MRLLRSSFALPIQPKSIPSKLTPTSPISVAKTLGQGLAALGRRMQKKLVGSHEPVIEERRDRTGALYWRVYDPITQDRKFFYSEDDVRVWLDQRYYQ